MFETLNTIIIAVIINNLDKKEGKIFDRWELIILALVRTKSCGWQSGGAESWKDSTFIENEDMLKPDASGFINMKIVQGILQALQGFAYVTNSNDYKSRTTYNTLEKTMSHFDSAQCAIVFVQHS